MNFGIKVSGSVPRGVPNHLSEHPGRSANWQPPEPRLDMAALVRPFACIVLLPRQGGPPSGGKPSDWVGPPPWVVRPTAASVPSSSPSESSSASGIHSESIAPSPEASTTSSPATVDDSASTDTSTTRSPGVPIGVIVGGVLAGLGLVAAALLVWWLLKRRKRREATASGDHQVVSPFHTDIEHQQTMAGGVTNGRDRSSYQTTTSTLVTDAGSQKGYLKSIHSIQRTASTAGSYLSTDASTSIMTPTSTEDPQVLQAIRTLQTFLQPRMERIPEHHSSAVVSGFAEPPTSPPPPAYEDSSSSGDPAPRSTEKTRTENE
jgi:hypothetical protein